MHAAPAAVVAAPLAPPSQAFETKYSPSSSRKGMTSTTRHARRRTQTTQDTKDPPARPCRVVRSWRRREARAHWNGHALTSLFPGVNSADASVAPVPLGRVVWHCGPSCDLPRGSSPVVMGRRRRVRPAAHGVAGSETERGRGEHLALSPPSPAVEKQSSWMQWESGSHRLWR